MKHDFCMKRLALPLAALLLLTAAACAKKGDAAPAAPAPAAEATPETVEMTPAETAAPAEETAAPDVEQARLNAYRAALTALLTNHVLPDGTDCGFDPAGDPADNLFALYDVDLDGQTELVTVYTTAASAGQTLGVFDYDASAGAMKTELIEYPFASFFDNGVIRVGWSHNQGLAGSFWPYTVYAFDAAADAYRNVGMVDAWDKGLAATDSEGNAFPDDVDTSGTGVVYYIMENGAYETVSPVDASAYEAWRAAAFGDAAEVELPFVALTEENIQSIA